MFSHAVWRNNNEGHNNIPDRNYPTIILWFVRNDTSDRCKGEQMA